MRKLLFTLVFVQVSSLASEIRPFESDGCSSFPDGSFEQNQLWLSCCVAHDRAYWKGGTYADRLAADKELEACVSAVGESEIALLMLTGVRVGGTPYFPSTFRWGYGWPFPRGYKALTEDEIRQIEAMEGDH